MKVDKETWEQKAKNLQDRRDANPITPNFDLYKQICDIVHVGDSVADIGCGQGYLEKCLPKGVSYEGYDPFPVNDKHIKATAEDLVKQKKRFKSVFMLAALYNVIDVKKALQGLNAIATDNIVILTGIGIEPNEYHTFRIDEHHMTEVLGEPTQKVELLPKVWLYEWRKGLPKVSIIIPYKADRGWLDLAVESVNQQTYRGEIELIFSQSDKSVGYNLNRGIEAATGMYVKYLCDDDQLTANSIEDSVRAMEGNDFIHGNAFNVFETHQQLQLPRLTHPTLADMIHNNVIHGGTLMYRRDVFDRVGLFDESLRSAEEYDFNMKCLYHGLKLGYCNATLYRYRRHETQKSMGKGIDQAERKIRIDALKERYK